MSEAVLVLLLALLPAVATGLGAPPFLFVQEPTRKWLGISNAAAAGLMLAASLSLAYEGALRGLLGGAVGTAVDPTNSLTIQNASASTYGMTVGLVWWSIGIVLAAVYFTVIYRLFRGKVRL